MAADPRKIVRPSHRRRSPRQEPVPPCAAKAVHSPDHRHHRHLQPRDGTEVTVLRSTASPSTSSTPFNYLSTAIVTGVYSPTGINFLDASGSNTTCVVATARQVILNVCWRTQNLTAAVGSRRVSRAAVERRRRTSFSHT